MADTTPTARRDRGRPRADAARRAATPVGRGRTLFRARERDRGWSRPLVRPRPGVLRRASRSAPFVRLRGVVGSRRLRWGVVAAGVVALCAHVVAMWTVGFHSQDGPAHVFAADALRQLWIGADTPATQVFELNLLPHPNWITYPALAVWLEANPPRVAELVLVSVLVIGVAAALHYAVTATGRGPAALAVAGFPVAVGYAVHTGLYNFTAGVAVLLVVVGYHLRVASRLDPRRTLVLAGLLVVLYASHPLSLTVALLAVAVIGLAALVADGRGAWSWRFVVGRLAALAVAAGPSIALLLWFLTDPGSVTPGPDRSVWDSVANTLLLRWPVRAVSRDDIGLAVALAAVVWLVVAALLARKVVTRRWNRWDALLVLPLATGAAAVFVPDRIAGGTLVQPRQAIFALLTLLIWAAVANPGGALVRGVATFAGVGGVVVMVGLLVVRIGPYREMSAAVDEVVAVAEHIPPGSVLLGAVSSRAPNHSPVTPMVHIVDRLAVEADALPASTLDAGSGYGPIRYRDRFDVSPALRGLPRNRTHGREVDPRRFANIVERYGAVTRDRIDYLVLVAYDLRAEERREFVDLGFRPVGRTAAQGLVWLLQAPPPRPNSDVELRR